MAKKKIVETITDAVVEKVTDTINGVEVINGCLVSQGVFPTRDKADEFAKLHQFRVK